MIKTTDTEAIIAAPIEIPVNYFGDKYGIKKIIIESDFDFDDDCYPHFITLKGLEEFDVRCKCDFFTEDGVLYYNAVVSPFFTKNFINFNIPINGRVLVAYPPGRQDKEFTIPSDVVMIVDGAFAGSSLEKLVIPDSVEHIGFSAFLDMHNLKSLYVPNRLINLMIDHYDESNVSFELFPNREEITLDEDVIHLWNYVRNKEPYYEFERVCKIPSNDDIPF